MSDTDSATMHIHFIRVNAQHFDVGQCHHTESLVDFPHGNILFVDAMSL